MALISLRNINKSFKKNDVLNQLSLEVMPNTVIYIKGANGSGKSTLLKIISKLMEPNEGDVIIDKNSKIGALIENPTFIEAESAFFNLKFLYELTNDSNDDDIKKWLFRFQLNPDSKEKMKNYSVGMRQKVGIIQAMMENQDIILLDEPTRGLDDESVIIFDEVIAELVDAGKTIVVCAHDQTSIAFDEKYLLKNGKLLKNTV